MKGPSVPFFSLTRRIIATVLIGQIVLTAALTLMAVLYARYELRGAFDATLRGRATATLALVRYTESPPYGLRFDSSLLPPSSVFAQRGLFEIRGSDGQLIARTEGAPVIPGEVMRSTAMFSDFALGDRPYRAVALRNVAVLDDEEGVQTASRVTVVYAASLDEVHERLVQLGFAVAGTSLFLLLITSGVAAWGVRRGLEPLHDLATQAGAISVRNWDFHPPPDATMTMELAPLAGAIETVLSRLRESFRQQRDFTSDAAHELKTSVAIVKSTLQSLLQRPRREEEYRAGLEGMLEDCGRLEDLLGRMLRLARIEQWADGGKPRDLGTTELISTCEAAISRLQGVASLGVSLAACESRVVHLRADPEDLELIWVNLLENALHHSPAGATVAMRIQQQRQTAGAAFISVEDSGSGIPSAELPYVFERFRRGDPSRARSTGGFGLGLAICKALVTAYGGRIEATNGLVAGTAFHVHLPAEL